MRRLFFAGHVALIALAVGVGALASFFGSFLMGMVESVRFAGENWRLMMDTARAVRDGDQPE